MIAVPLMLIFLSSHVRVMPGPLPRTDSNFQIAITVDDLSGNGELPPGKTRLGVARAYLRALRYYRVPQAYGFVNASLLRRDPDGDSVLKVWRRAGNPLGNHTYSHMHLDHASSLEAWIADVGAGESAIARRARGSDWHYFRFPFLAAGADLSRHNGALTYLRSRGYRIADVSVTFNDWAYSDAYARCLGKGDQEAIRAMKTQYLIGVDNGIARMRALSFRVYGRLIPQVLLTHLSSWSAETLPEVLKRLNAAGAEYATLQQVQSDVAYAQAGPNSWSQLLMDRAAFERKSSLDKLPRIAAIENILETCR